MRVAVVTVGDELLAGDTVNTNATWLCEQLTERGVRVERVTTVPDDLSDIARVVNEYNAEYDAVLVTGGLGPTHDDKTMAAVAAAFGREVEEHPDVVAWFDEHGGYSGDDLAEGTTHLPAGSRMLPNEEGVAPGCVIDSVYVFPGVPGEMKAMFGLVADDFAGEKTYTATVTTPEPESTLLDRMQGVQEAFDVDLGSYPGENVRLKVTARDPETAEAAARWLRERVESVEVEE
ncbi:molybdenum cofactor synthesis domain-containing protein [Halogranum gelatinilyticum]|uniref:Molybdenum cofactor synthesis domain-containing protein n=1 Tax=Halogranum gelatinilyticum TaxID=660521 RepID=A0A1H0A6Y2_9EURY|nr:molybdopterin-binding protein [Halogranum gelatinilyticum]SDN29388.1 molybdenum cofactor synthesis domain-containing protein [Halogranum gelatinilyticum]